MKNNYQHLIFSNLGKAARNPLTAAKLVWRRLFPFGIIPKDKTAYRIGSWSYGKLAREDAASVFPQLINADIEIIKAFDRDITTSVDLYELTVICGLIRSRKPLSILEIGTFNGNTTANMALNAAPEAKIFTVDLPEDWNGKTEIKIPSIYINTTDRSSIGKHFRDQPDLAAKITQVFADSGTLDWSSLNTGFDLIFIDGNHHYNYVLSDTKNALSVLNPKGIILWHDYGMIEDVSKVVDQFTTELEIHAIAGTRLAVGKKK